MTACGCPHSWFELAYGSIAIFSGLFVVIGTAVALYTDFTKSVLRRGRPW